MLDKTKRVLELIANDPFFEKYDVRFVGGTALSLLIKHRLSEDLDFAILEIPREAVVSLMKKYGAAQREHSRFIIDSAINDGEDINDSHMMFDLDGVKIDFFSPPFNIKETAEWNNYSCVLYNNTNVKIAAFETIFYMKIMAFWNRKKYRDLYDIYFVLNNKINGYTPKKFIEKYIGYNISYTKEDLLCKIESKKDFFERNSDEGLKSLVGNPMPYEWYRNELYEMIYDVYLEDIYTK
ncbi:nucleotidyl transferase AbiEii/AbiGii toxin family protein [Sulfurimonas sp.]